MASPTQSWLHIPLERAYLCEDCHTVGNCSTNCPACASNALLCLAGVLNRECEEKENEIVNHIKSTA
jgi:hypothetical protein